MSALGEHLKARIRAGGPMSVAEYMSTCLMHPTLGYYVTRDPFGVSGDFTTAPEISQMFGELLGLALAQAWLDRGRPDPFRLVELGPGRGTLMADVMRATKGVEGFHEAADLWLVETSPVLRARQIETINAPLTHADALSDVPGGPLFLIANEFFDALPIRQFVRTETAWRERVVGLDGEALSLGLSDETAPDHLAHRLDDTAEGDVVEQAHSGAVVAGEIGARIAESGGLAYLVDYGDWRSLGDTFQALRAHEPVSVLEAPGAVDLTAHVDFEALARAAEPAVHSRLTPQGVFLGRLGIEDRAEALAANLDGEALQSHIAAFRRLTDEREMGTLFKVMAVFQADAPLPPGVTL